MDCIYLFIYFNTAQNHIYIGLVLLWVLWFVLIAEVSCVLNPVQICHVCNLFFFFFSSFFINFVSWISSFYLIVFSFPELRIVEAAVDV